jgi:predicted nucleic acid-binding protein
VSSPTLAEAIPPGASLLIDTSVALAYLTGTESISPIATQLFDGFLATGRDRGALSMVTVGEILVRPFGAGPAALAIAEGFLRHFAELELIPIDYGTAREAARIRASTDLRMPDALILSSAMASGADLVVTNDQRLAAAAQRFDIASCLLGDLRSVSSSSDTGVAKVGPRE